MTNFEKLDLYPHNIESSANAINAFEEGQDTVALIQATGTGKSYNGLALALEYKELKTLWVVPLNSIKEHIEQTINANPNINRERDFPNLEIKSYQSFANMTEEEIANIPCDLLIIDEIQHLTAPVWGARMNKLVETHQNMKKLGLTAYTTNYRGTIYERDVTNPDTDEIFSGAVVNEYDLYDAIIDGVLPKPIVKSVITEDSEIIIEIKEKIAILKAKGDKSYLEYQKILDDVIRMIHSQDGVKELIQQTVIPDGKYIYFCPLYTEEGKNDMESIMKRMRIYLEEKYPDKKIVFYKTTSADGDVGKYNRDCFYNDIDLEGNDAKDCIRIMFAKNQYNEGVHAPNVDGVFLGRRTRSDIVAFEQIGRGLSVRGDTYKRIEAYNQYSIEELKQLAKTRGIPIDENTSKEQIIEILCSPMIIDLADNIEYLEELESNLGTRLKEVREQGPGNKRVIRITDPRIDISVINKDLLAVLQKVRENLRNRTWDDTYNLLVAFHKANGHCEVSKNFITVDGVNPAKEDENGAVNLYRWCHTQRGKKEKLIEERRRKLELIGFSFENQNDLAWERSYKLLVAFYKENGHCNVPKNFITIDGVNLANKDVEEVVNLYDWCIKQRNKQDKLTKERRRKLEAINFNFENQLDLQWERKYKLLVAYYEANGHCKVPKNFITVDGVNPAPKNDEGAENLYTWYYTQKLNQDKLTEERRKKLEAINFEFKYENDLAWERNYNLLVAFYKANGHCKVPYGFITIDGVNPALENEKGAVKLYIWCGDQRNKQRKLTEERRKKLEVINFNFGSLRDLAWERNYNLLVAYYEANGHCNAPTDFITTDGVSLATKDTEGAENLFDWCIKQRNKQEKLTEERRRKLELIGFRFITKKEHKDKLIELCNKYNLDYNKNKFLMKIPYQELYSKIEFLLENKYQLQINGILNPIFNMSNADMQKAYGISKEELITKYYLSQGRGL